MRFFASIPKPVPSCIVIHLLSFFVTFASQGVLTKHIIGIPFLWHISLQDSSSKYIFANLKLSGK